MTGETNRRLTFQALYDSFVRVDKDRFVADKNVHFDIDTIDKIVYQIGLLDDEYQGKTMPAFKIYGLDD